MNGNSTKKRTFAAALLAAALMLSLAFTSVALAQSIVDWEGPIDDEGNPVRPCGTSYEVKVGDTLSRISVMCDVPVNEILAANPQITDMDLLIAGTELTLPEEDWGDLTFPSGIDVDYSTHGTWGGNLEAGLADTGGTAISEGTGGSVGLPDTGQLRQQMRPASEYARPNPFNPFALYTPNGSQPGPCGKTYEVKSGDSLSQIAVRCNVPMANLLAENPSITDVNVIRTGMKLSLPLGDFGEITFPSGADIPHEDAEEPIP